MSERIETHDFMSVDSFSQLPFIRPSAAKPSSSSSPPSSTSPNNNNNIRLFGFDLPPDHNPPSSSSKDSHPSDEDGANPTAASVAAPTARGGGGSGSDQSGRKFECHYCCRNFPTSQALGGHQNAHKRERQHAKRAHLQSAMVAAHHSHHHHPPIAEEHVYGILNYHRLGSAPSAAARFGLDPPHHYPSWSNSTGAGGPRFYGGLGSASQPINGNPLPAGLWRVPSGAVGMVVQPDSRSVAVLPNLLGAGGGGGSIESRPTPMGMGGNYHPPSSTSSSSPSRPYDGVSLDLHL